MSSSSLAARSCAAAGSLLVGALSGSGPVAATTSKEFGTPSRNIECNYSDFYGDYYGQYGPSIRCDIGDFSYTPPAPEESCGVVFGHSLGFTVGRAPEFGCAHDSLVAPHTMSPGEVATVLAYGQSIRLGPFRCTSSAQGLECVEESSGHGFTLSRERYSLK